MLQQRVTNLNPSLAMLRMFGRFSITKALETNDESELGRDRVKVLLTSLRLRRRIVTTQRFERRRFCTLSFWMLSRRLHWSNQGTCMARRDHGDTLRACIVRRDSRIREVPGSMRCADQAWSARACDAASKNQRSALSRPTSFESIRGLKWSS